MSRTEARRCSWEGTTASHHWLAHGSAHASTVTSRIAHGVEIIRRHAISVEQVSGCFFGVSIDEYEHSCLCVSSEMIENMLWQNIGSRRTA